MGSPSFLDFVSKDSGSLAFLDSFKHELNRWKSLWDEARQTRLDPPGSSSICSTSATAWREWMVTMAASSRPYSMADCVRCVIENVALSVHVVAFRSRRNLH